MKYALLYKPKNQYLNLGQNGFDKLNLGIQPKLYDSLSLAKIALEKDLPDALQRQRTICSNAELGLHDHGRPKWYRERETKKLTKRQQEKLDWYENALKRNRDLKKFIDSFKISDVQIVELEN